MQKGREGFARRAQAERRDCGVGPGGLATPRHLDPTTPQEAASDANEEFEHNRLWLGPPMEVLPMQNNLDLRGGAMVRQVSRRVEPDGFLVTFPHTDAPHRRLSMFPMLKHSTEPLGASRLCPGTNPCVDERGAKLLRLALH